MYAFASRTGTYRVSKTKNNMKSCNTFKSLGLSHNFQENKTNKNTIETLRVHRENDPQTDRVSEVVLSRAILQLKIPNPASLTVGDKSVARRRAGADLPSAPVPCIRRAHFTCNAGYRFSRFPSYVKNVAWLRTLITTSLKPHQRSSSPRADS